MPESMNEVILDETQQQEVTGTGLVETTPDETVDALQKPFTEYSVVELLLLIIVILMLVSSLMKLFMRSWGFPEW